MYLLIDDVLVFVTADVLIPNDGFRGKSIGSGTVKIVNKYIKHANKVLSVYKHIEKIM